MTFEESKQNLNNNFGRIRRLINSYNYQVDRDFIEIINDLEYAINTEKENDKKPLNKAIVNRINDYILRMIFSLGNLNIKKEDLETVYNLVNILNNFGNLYKIKLSNLKVLEVLSNTKEPDILKRKISLTDLILLNTFLSDTCVQFSNIAKRGIYCSPKFEKELETALDIVQEV